MTFHIMLIVHQRQSLTMGCLQFAVGETETRIIKNVTSLTSPTMPGNTRGPRTSLVYTQASTLRHEFPSVFKFDKCYGYRYSGRLGIGRDGSISTHWKLWHGRIYPGWRNMGNDDYKSARLITKTKLNITALCMYVV